MVTRVLAFVLLVTLTTPLVVCADEKVDFNRDILPILSTSCFQCHGPDQNARKADLRLDDREISVGKKRSIIPGKPGQSELIARLESDDADERMPPPKAGEKLSKQRIALLRSWIEQGAEYADHWAFIAPQRPQLPEVQGVAAVASPIDRFVVAKLEKEKVEPAAAASREVLIRRATLDLIGLPPTPAEVDVFVADQSPDAFQKLIDRLLDSPHYGERWGRHWLDVARYADSGGFETDIFNGHAWRFRDYVVRSLNADKPFNRFIQEQVAGDELFPGDAEARLATSFFTIGPVLQESGMVPGKLEYDQMTDAADTTGSAFLGLTMGCARCHDHKYDPISQREYYGLQAVFADSDQFDLKPDGGMLRGRAAIKNTLAEFELEQAKERARVEQDPEKRAEFIRKLGDAFKAKTAANSKKGNRRGANSADFQASLKKYQEIVARHEAEGSDVSDAVMAERQKELDEQSIEVGRRLVEAEPRGSEVRKAFRSLEIDTEIREFLLELAKKQLADIPATPTNDASQSGDEKAPEELAVAESADPRLALGEKHINDASEIPDRVLAHRESPVEVHVLARGELEQPGDAVDACLPARIAREQKFGDVPPEKRRAELANWLGSDRNPLTARVIVNRVWLWHFGQGLVRTPNDFGLHGDPPTHPELLDWLTVDFIEHGWSLKHLHRMIMASQAYQRSSVVAPEVVARDPENRLLARYQPHRAEAEVIWDNIRAVAGTLDLKIGGLPIAPALDDQEQIGNFRKWPTSTPGESNRRAIYILVRRSFRFPVLGAFDLPDNISSCPQRDITTVPNQALTLLNNKSFEEQAGLFAMRLVHEAGEKPADIAALAWKYAYGRQIAADERERAVAFLSSHESNGESGGSLKQSVDELCLALFNTNEFLYLP
jgi:hypothetical protein